jgi:translation initiation factor 3 subunit E
MAPFMDPHLLLPMLNHLKELGANTDSAELDVVSATKMVDYEKELFSKVHAGAAPPAELDAKGAAVLARFDALDEPLGALRKLMEEEPETVQQMRDEAVYTVANLSASHGVTAEHVEMLYEYAKLTYETGNYSLAKVYLGHYQLLGPEGSPSVYRAGWGKLAAEILEAITLASNPELQSQEDHANVQAIFAQAAADLQVVSSQIDESSDGALDQLSKRAWLLHWSLFVFFQQAEGGREALVEFFFQEKYVNTIQTYCPWLLRYLAFAIVTDKRHWHDRKKDNLLKMITLETYEYSDPITEFVAALMRDSDFAGAQSKLEGCAEALSQDYFLAPAKAEFLELAKECIFEMKCRIHQKIDMDRLASSLNLKQSDAERWIIGLINDSKLDAKIDSASNHVEMAKSYPSIYTQIVSKTKHLTYQTHALHNQVREYYGECQQQAEAEAAARRARALQLAQAQKAAAEAKAREAAAEAAKPVLTMAQKLAMKN